MIKFAFFMEYYQFEYKNFATHLNGVHVTGHSFHACMVEKGIILCDFLQLIYQRFSAQPGQPLKWLSVAERTFNFYALNYWQMHFKRYIPVVKQSTHL